MTENEHTARAPITATEVMRRQEIARVYTHGLQRPVELSAQAVIERFIARMVASSLFMSTLWGEDAAIFYQTGRFPQ